MTESIIRTLRIIKNSIQGQKNINNYTIEQARKVSAEKYRQHQTRKRVLDKEEFEVILYFLDNSDQINNVDTVNYY